MKCNVPFFAFFALVAIALVASVHVTPAAEEEAIRYLEDQLDAKNVPNRLPGHAQMSEAWKTYLQNHVEEKVEEAFGKWYTEKAAVLAGRKRLLQLLEPTDTVINLAGPRKLPGLAVAKQLVSGFVKERRDQAAARKLQEKHEWGRTLSLSTDAGPSNA
ncbi:uncharacterized protein MEPE_02950 [Melanopsichium pennsylvanicum]|uniref:Uncharacterized protein n=1 Tax=Melanopsichium pennsylvanicum TaxID=63383 RepID=A0AAJ5C509_9BASI|nr:uncharacterized protein MEPE_02950 [Melanopsichium pennsylvanicum]